MKAQFLQASGIDNEQDFLSKYPTQEAFFKEFPNMQELTKGPGDNETDSEDEIDPNKKRGINLGGKPAYKPPFDPDQPYEEVKKKKVSVSTVPKQKLASGVPANGSLDGKKYNKVSVPVTKPNSEKTGNNKIINTPKPAEKEYDFVDSLLDNLDSGLATVAKSLYDAPALVYDTFASVTNIIPKILGAERASSEKFAKTFGLRNVPAEVLKEKIDRTNKSIQIYNDKNGGDAFEAVSSGNYLGAAKMIAGTTMQSLPLMVAAMATGGSSASLLAIGTSTASTKAAELKESNPEMDVATRTVNAAVSGVIEATMGHLLNGASGAVVKKIIADKGAEAGSKLISKSFRAVIEKTIEKNPVIAGFGEILEESLVEGGNQINDMASGIRTEFDFKAIANAGLSATGMGIGNTVAIYGAKGFVNANDYKKAKTINKEITKLSTELSNENLSDSDKQLLSTRIDRLVTGNKKLIGDGMDKITALPVPVKQELVSINSSLDELKSKILDIQDNYDISEDTKNALIDEIKQQGQELSIRKQKVIEGGYIYDDFDKLPQEAKNRLKDEAGRILLEEAKKEGKTSASFDDAQLSKKAAELRNEELKAVFEIDNMENTTTQTSAPTSGEVAAPSVNPLDNSTVVEQTTLTAIEPIKSIKESVEDNGIYYYDGEKGALSIDGQQVVFETKDKIIELGNIDDLSQNDIKDLGLEQESEINISLNDDMSIEVNGIQYLNNYSNPESAISQDKDGNYTVSLDTKNGQKRNFRGQQADQIVYQYKLKNLEENATEQQIESASQLADEAIRVEEEIRESSPKRKAKSVRKSKQRTLKTVKEPLNNKEKQQQVANEIEILRADEQAELREVIPDAEQFVTDGKIDKTKLENTKDKQKFDEIYDRYDKLITPLLEQQNEATPPTDTPANGNVQLGTPIVEQDAKQEIDNSQNIQKPVDGGESKGDVEVDAVGKKIGSKKTNGISASVTDLFIKEIQTDESRFQNREGLDEERVQNIVENFDENKLDPITVFEESGKYTVLSGHHRFEAMKRMGVNKIAVKIFEGTEAEAKEFAKDSNTLGKQETVIERAKRYRELREQGMSEKQISDMARQAHGSDAVKIVNMSRLDSSGKAIKTVKQFENSSDTDTKNKVQAVADWIGQVKSKHSDLSRVQENEMFDYLMDSYSTKKGSGKITNKMQFFDLADALVKRLKEKGNFDQDSVLNFKNSLGKSSIELEYDKILQDAKEAVKLAQKELDDKRSSLLLNGAKKEDFDRVLPAYEDKLQNAIKNENDIRKDKGLLKDAVRDQVSLFDEIQNEILDEKPNVQREVQDVFEGNEGKTPEGERGAKEVQPEPNKAEQGVAAKILNQDNVKGVLDFLDDLKMDLNDLKSTIPFTPQAWNTFIEALKISIKAGNSTIKAIEYGVKLLNEKNIGNTEINNIVSFFKDKYNNNKKVSIVLEKTKESNVSLKKENIRGRFLSEIDAKNLQKEIESKYSNSSLDVFNTEVDDIRLNAFNYDNPLATKVVNGVELRIASGLIRKNKSGINEKTWLLYADGKVAGEFYSVKDIKNVINFIENNLVKVFDNGSISRILNQDNIKNTLKTLDSVKLDPNNLYSTIPFAPQVWNAFIEAVKLSVKAGNSIQKAIQEGINAVRNQGLNQTEVDDIVTYFNDKLNKNATGHTEIFTDIENAISQGKTKEEILDAYTDSKEKRQVENIYNRIVSKNISEEDAYDEVKAAFDKARTELEYKKPTKELIRSAYRGFVKRFTDRQYLAKRLLDRAGFKNVKNLVINAHGASGKAKMQFQEAYDKIYKGLSRAERNSLDEIIQAKRFIAIDEARELQGKGPVTHPNFIDKNKSEKFLSQLEKEMGTKKYTDLTKRAEAYFATYKNLLTQMKENGLITQEAFDAMEADYQPRVFLQYVTDFEGNIEAGKQSNQVDTGGLSSDQIKSLSDGDANSLVLNSEYLLTNSLLARSKAMAINNVNKRFMTGDFQEAKKRFEKLDPRNLKGDDVRFYKYFKELNTKVIDNPIIGFTDSGNAKYQYDKTPANFQKAYYFVDGQRNEFFMEKELHESWFDNMNHILSSGAKEFISYASGSALLKGIATGNNPAFPIVNTPRDFLFTVAFSDQYSKIVPKAMLQVGKDVVKAIAEIRKPQSDVLQKYMEYGGAMDFLSSQGKLKKSSVIGKAIDKAVSPNARDISKAVFDKLTLHKIAQYSEIMFRLGIFERSIQNQLKGLGLNDVSQVTDKQQLDDIYNEAVSSARSILDFNQGGTVTKDLEAVIPYINVAFQGGRVAATAFEKDPAGTTSRILQVATLASAVPIGISLALISGMKGDDDEDKSAYEIYLHALDGISPYQKMRYMNIVTPVKDEEGEYMVLKIAKAQELSPFMSLTDDIYNNFIRGLAGKEKKSAGAITKSVLSTFNDNVMPIDFSSPAGLVTRNPVVKATLTYATGYDFFRDQPLSNDIGKVPLPVEGITMKSTEEFYKKIGDNFGLSPVRSKAFVESLITSPSTNPFVGMLYGGADAAVSDKDIKIIGKDLFQTIYKSTGKRVVSYSSNFNRKLAGKVELQDEIDAINIKQYKEKAEFNKVAKQFVDKEISKEDLRSKISEAEPSDRKRIVNKVKDKIRFKDIDATIIDIKYEQGAAVKALLIAHYYGDILDKSEDSKKVLRQMAQVKGILTPEVMIEYKKLKEGLKTKTPN